MKKSSTRKLEKQVSISNGFLQVEQKDIDPCLGPKKSTLEFLKRFAHSYYAMPSADHEFQEIIQN